MMNCARQKDVSGKLSFRQTECQFYFHAFAVWNDIFSSFLTTNVKRLCEFALNIIIDVLMTAMLCSNLKAQLTL